MARYSTQTSLNAVTATGAGSAVTPPWNLEENNNCGVFLSSTGTPTTVTVNVEVSPDGTNWFIVGSALSPAATKTATAVTLPPGTYQVRLNLTALTGGTTPTVTGSLGFQSE